MYWKNDSFLKVRKIVEYGLLLPKSLQKVGIRISDVKKQKQPTHNLFSW